MLRRSKARSSVRSWMWIINHCFVNYHPSNFLGLYNQDTFIKSYRDVPAPYNSTSATFTLVRTATRQSFEVKPPKDESNNTAGGRSHSPGPCDFLLLPHRSENSQLRSSKQFHKTGDAFDTDRGITDFYTSDARLNFANSPTIIGIDNIRATMVAQTSALTYMKHEYGPPLPRCQSRER